MINSSIVGIGIILIGLVYFLYLLNLFKNKSKLSKYVKKSPKTFILRKLFGIKKSLILVKKLFIPLGFLFSIVIVLYGVKIFFALNGNSISFEALQAMGSENLEECKKLTGQDRETCIYVYALDMNDLSACKIFSDNNKIISCYSYVSWKTNNIEICNEFQEDELVACYALTAYLQEDSVICDSITTELVSNCYQVFEKLNE